LQCHHCELTIPLYTACPCCKTKNPKPVGMGTERLEAALQENFPTQSIVRIDRDTTRKKGELKKAIDLIHSGEADILIGTQMIAKGHHFPNVTLVGILDIDHALFSTDFRSIEKMGQLITQVAGRSGRAERPGHVILQTCHPEHPLLKQLLEKGYSEFSSSLLTERKMTNLPPYSYQVLIRAEAVVLEKALAFLSFVKKEALLKAISKLTISGPIAAPMERRLGKYRAQLLFQSPKRSTLQQLLQKLVPKIESNSIVNTVKWSLDVDPIDMY
ncbi:MAG TPA: primosomal protein N', partial [Gammaproteobacteria bacterium]|nr:primosomal protein N' [Gammaproteobacteria bacterium]